jgi:hypothetical protein
MGKMPMLRQSDFSNTLLDGWPRQAKLGEATRYLLPATKDQDKKKKSRHPWHDFFFSGESTTHILAESIRVEI